MATNWRRRLSLLVLLGGVLGCAFTVSCRDEPEGDLPAFEMTYRMIEPGGQTWRLDYESADDWTKTLTGDERSPESVGRTVAWDGDRLRVAESPDGEFEEVVGSKGEPSLALPERFFDPTLRPEAVESYEVFPMGPLRDGELRYRLSTPFASPVEVNGERYTRSEVIIAFDEETGIPLELEDELNGQHVLVLDLTVK